MNTLLVVARAVWWCCIIMLVYTYGIYPGLLFLLARLFGKEHTVDTSYKPTVGFLIPAHNEEKVIRKKVENILALNYPSERISLWIGSDCSHDKTEAIVKGFADERIHLWRAPHRMGKTGIINYLAPQINAQIIVFTDANTFHAADSLVKLTRHFADPRVGGVAGHIEHKGSAADVVEEKTYRTFEATQKTNESKLHSCISAFGGFYAIRKKLFRTIPHNAYSNDDVLIPMNVVRQRHRVIYDKEAKSEEASTQDIRQEFKRRIRIGAGNFQAFLWLVEFLNPFKGWVFLCFVSHKVCRWFSPLLLLLWLSSSLFLLVATHELLYSLVTAAAVFLLTVGLSFLLSPHQWNRQPFYFIAMTCALFLGFIRYTTGIKSAAWERTDRTIPE